MILSNTASFARSCASVPGVVVHSNVNIIHLSWSLLCSCRFWYALHKLESVF